LVFVGLFPPLERIGARSQSVFVRAFNTPPALRFYLFEGSNFLFTVILTFIPLPIHRDAPEPARDWILLVWSVACFFKEMEFILARGVLEYVKDVHNIIGLFASTANCASLFLNVCNGADWPLFLQGTGKVREIALGDPSSFGAMWERCGEGSVPLAAREVLAFGIFLRWLNLLPRVSSRSVFFGPLILMVRTMAWDTIQFMLLLFWIIFAWAFFFSVLFREGYGHAVAGSLADWGCDMNPDFDYEYRDPSSTILTPLTLMDKLTGLMNAVKMLWEATLLGDGNFKCMELSSAGWLPMLFMYVFVLTSTIMLMNMLIAMMAESFSNIYSNRLEYFFFLRARHCSMWLSYAPVPPPLNLLRAPYELLYLPFAIAMYASKRLGYREKEEPEGKPFMLPADWVEENGHDKFTERIVDFIQSDSSKQTGEIVKAVGELNDAASKSVLSELKDVRGAIAQMRGDFELFQMEIMSMKQSHDADSVLVARQLETLDKTLQRSASSTNDAQLPSVSDQMPSATPGKRLIRRVRKSKSRSSAEAAEDDGGNDSGAA